MNLRCVFHLSPTAVSNVQSTAERKRMPSVVDEVEVESSPTPRGRSFETWTRARGWASED